MIILYDLVSDIYPFLKGIDEKNREKVCSGASVANPPFRRYNEAQSFFMKPNTAQGDPHAI
jgi:hypothetical protein